MRWVGAIAALLAVVCTAVWARPDAGLVVAGAIVVQVGIAAYILRADRRTAASIEANVRQAVARRDRVLGRSPRGRGAEPLA